ncbi:MAG: hypothetical protein HYV95_16050 [Opitutae bacterium]|nr:hypothetical protein [Opitutae bacterium]
MNTNGGFIAEAFLVAAIGAAGFIAAGIINNWEDFKTGLQEGYNTYQPTQK